jgi:hypothetical protein
MFMSGVLWNFLWEEPSSWRHAGFTPKASKSKSSCDSLQFHHHCMAMAMAFSPLKPLQDNPPPCLSGFNLVTNYQSKRNSVPPLMSQCTSCRGRNGQSEKENCGCCGQEDPPPMWLPNHPGIEDTILVTRNQIVAWRVWTAT